MFWIFKNDLQVGGTICFDHPFVTCTISSNGNQMIAQLQGNNASLMFKHFSIITLIISVTGEKAKGCMISDGPHANCCFSNDK